MSTSASISTITLRTGAVVPTSIYLTVSILLDEMLPGAPIVFYETVMIARDPGHKIVNHAIERKLHASNLLENGIMHGLTRDVVLSRSEGDGTELVMCSGEPE